MCFPYISASGHQSAKMVDFVAPSQTRENGLSQPFGLAREGYLPILATLAIQLCSYVGYVAIVVILVPKWSILLGSGKPGKWDQWGQMASRAKVIYLYWLHWLYSYVAM